MNSLTECAIHRMIVTLRTVETAMRLPWHREMLMEGAELTLNSAEVYLERNGGWCGGRTHKALSDSTV